MRISMTGIKGDSESIELARWNLLLGGNGSGKTKITQGIKLLALGYDPALGKRPMDQAAIMEGEELSVQLVLDDDREMTRTIRAGEKGYESIAHAAWLPSSAKPGEHASAISNLFGTDDVEIAQCLDITQLLKLSPNKRAAVLEELLGATEDDPSAVARDIIHHALIQMIGISPEKAPEGNAKMMAMIAEAQIPILKAAGATLIGKLKAHGLDGAMSWARAEKLAEDSSLKKKIAAEKELRTKLHGSAETQPEELDRLGRELKEAEAAITAEKTRRESRDRRADMRAKAEADVKKFGLLVLEKNTDLVGLREDHPNIQSHRPELKKIGETLDKMPGAAPLDLKAVIELRKKAEDQRQKAKAVPSIEAPSIDAETKAVADLTSKIDTAGNDPWRKIHVLAGAILAWIKEWDRQALEGVDFTDIDKAAQKIHSIASEKAGIDPDALRLKLEEAELALKAASKARDAKEMERNEKETLRAELEGGAQAIDVQADQKLAELEAGAAEGRKEIEEQAAKLRKRRDNLKILIETYDATAQKIRDEAHVAKENHKEAQGRAAALSGHADEPKANVEDLEHTRDRLLDEMESLQTAAGKRAAIGDLVKEIASAKHAAEIYGALMQGAKLVRQAGVTAAGSGLTKLMSGFLSAGRWPHAPYIRATQKACEIGWRRPDGTEIPIQAMSGGEWALFAASLSASMISLRKAELRILIVEAGEADQDLLQAILKGIEYMAEALTASLVLTHVPIVFTTPGWEHHEFEITETRRLGHELEHAIKSEQMRGEGATG